MVTLPKGYKIIRFVVFIKTPIINIKKIIKHLEVYSTDMNSMISVIEYEIKQFGSSGRQKSG